MADPAVVVFDTTLRDGEQAPGFSMRVEEKIQLARQLDALGVDIMEAGFPIASQDDAESVRRVATEVRRPVIAALARCAPGDIDAAFYDGKIHAALYYARNILPDVEHKAKLLAEEDKSPLDIPDAAFATV